MPYNIGVQAEVSGKIRLGAVKNHVEIMGLLNQTYGTLRDALVAGGMGGGVCRTLAVRWLAAQQNDDNFLKSLSGSSPGTIREGEAEGIVKEFKAMSEGLSDGDQAMFLCKELEEYGFSVSDTEFCTISNGKLRGLTLGEFICDDENTNPYRILGIRGNINHAMALSIAPNNIAFYDPNLGDFKFSNKIDLVRFFDTVFFPKNIFEYDPEKSSGERRQREIYDETVANYVGSSKKIFSKVELTACDYRRRSKKAVYEHRPRSNAILGRT